MALSLEPSGVTTNRIENRIIEIVGSREASGERRKSSGGERSVVSRTLVKAADERKIQVHDQIENQECRKCRPEAAAVVRVLSPTP